MLHTAVREVIERLAMQIINERRAEIEAACSFGELRDTLAAELARQFMASRLQGLSTPLDARSPYNSGSAGSPQAQLFPQPIIQLMKAKP